TVVEPELHAILDPLLVHEAIAILPPLQHALRGLARSFDDGLARLGLGENGEHGFAFQRVARDHIVHEARNLRASQVEALLGCERALRARRSEPERAGEQQQINPAVQMAYELTSFRCEYNAMRIPKPASRVTTDVPP